MKNATHYLWIQFALGKVKFQLTGSFVADNSKLYLTCPLLLLEQASGIKQSNQIDFKTLIKTPFDVVHNS